MLFNYVKNCWVVGMAGFEMDEEIEEELEEDDDEEEELEDE